MFFWNYVINVLSFKHFFLFLQFRLVDPERGGAEDGWH